MTNRGHLPYPPQPNPLGPMSPLIRHLPLCLVIHGGEKTSFLDFDLMHTFCVQLCNHPCSWSIRLASILKHIQHKYSLMMLLTIYSLSHLLPILIHLSLPIADLDRYPRLRCSLIHILIDRPSFIVH
jgi:hypothetical protein